MSKRRPRTATGYLVLRSGLIPANADAQPGRLESWAAGTSLDATLDRAAPKGPNPVALTDANLVAGINLYAEHCAICHGTAKGDASASPVAKGLYPPPPHSWRRMASRMIRKASPFGRLRMASAGPACPPGRAP